MQTLFRLGLLISLLATPLLAQTRKLGDVVIGVDKDVVAVRVSSTNPELNRLARYAFGAHGRYRVVESGFSYDIRFSPVSATQVRVDIMKGRDPNPAYSETVTGTNARNALLRAADVAVVKTNGLNLRGFFTAKLAFVGEGTGRKEIYVSDLFLGELRKITNDRALALSPRWSPDGSRILYTSYFQSGFPDIFEIDLANNRRGVFARFKGTNTGARYSPTGQQVVMVLSGTGGSEIWVANARGGAPVRRTFVDLAKSSPCWSPDGSQIVFAMGDTLPQLYVIPAAGGAPQRLQMGFRYAAEPDWNRIDRNKIACTVMSGSYQVAVYDFSKRSAEVVSKADFDGIEPAWLPDGRHLVYTARDRSTSVLCILDTVSGKSTRLTEGQPVGASMQASVLFGN